MKQSRKLKNVSWATGVNLCQVKLFLSEDSPSKVGFKSPDNLQPRGSSFVHPNSLVHSNCPPGFEFNRAVNSISLVRWKCPPKFIVTDKWLVAAGEESEDAKFQKQREVTVLEAVYPRISDIPPSPSVSLDVNEELHNDNLTPVVPMIPIEEEMSTDITVPTLSSNPMFMPDNQSLPTIPKNTSFNSQGEVNSVLSSLAGVDADVVAAASAALAVLMKSSEQGSLIDTNYLITILSDTKMIEKLIANGGQGQQINSSGPPADANSSPVPPAPSISISETKEQSGNSYQFYKVEPTSTDNSPVLDMVPEHRIVGHAQSAPSPLPLFSCEGNAGVKMAKQIFQPLNPIPETNTQSVGLVAKDINYYKNLIRQHGEQQENGQNGHPHNHGRDIKLVQTIKGGTAKPKNQKPCMYFNSLKGCRNGAGCPYKHEMSHNWQPGKLIETTPSSKRMRFSHGITGMMT